MDLTLREAARDSLISMKYIECSLKFQAPGVALAIEAEYVVIPT